MKKVGGDTSYAGTTNRDYCKDNKIQTSFVKRGRPSQTMKEKDFVRRELARGIQDESGITTRNPGDEARTKR